MFDCPSCGAATDADARYCPQCAAPLWDDAPPGGDEGVESDVLELARQGQKIQAIKQYREATGCGLKDAKDRVEALMAEHGIQSQSAGCLGGLLLVAITIAALVTASH